MSVFKIGQSQAQTVGPQTAYEKFRFPDDAAVTSLQQILKVCDQRLAISGRFDSATRDAIEIAKGKINQARKNGLLLPRLSRMAHERRKDLARFDGSRLRASMMFQPCFLAVEKKERMSAKSIAPSNERKPPEIF